MKKNVMVMSMLMISTMLFAQRHKYDPIAIADKRTDRMKSELSLSDEQYSRVKRINEKFGATLSQLRRDRSVSADARRTQMQKLQTDQDTQLRGILSADQWTKWSVWRAKQMDQRKARRRVTPDQG